MYAVITCLLFMAASPMKLAPSIIQQSPTAQDAKQDKTEETLAPLTAEERSLNPREILLNQPDFAADSHFFVSEGFGAYGGSAHVVRVGDRYREESQFWTFVGEIGQGSVRLYPAAKVFDDMVPPSIGASYGSLIYPKPFAIQSNRVTALGTVEIDGHKCLKIEVLPDGEDQKVFLYAALDLKNLVIGSERFGPKANKREKLTNVSLDPGPAQVEVPADFKSIEHHRWVKVETARVTYKGMLSKDYGVFRAPGGELFIWVSDAYYPWQYLYDPQTKTIAIAFQGLLVNRAGTYIWQTNETEAFSLNDHSGLVKPEAHLVETPNGIQFRSNNYDKDGAVIEVTW
jgi:hypothetical protein